VTLSILYGLFLGLRAIKRPSKIPHEQNSSFDNKSALSIENPLCKGRTEGLALR
jgi:hypothetical protein